MIKTLGTWVILYLLCVLPCSILWGCNDVLDDASQNILINTGNGPLFVSLGANCIPAGMIRHFGKRQAAFPFDWMRTTDEIGFLHLLHNNFQDFVNQEYLIKNPINGAGIVNNLYHIEFTHDWLQEWWENDIQYQEEIEKLKSKCQRRINRFQQLANYKGTVHFIRLELPAERNPDMFWFDYIPCIDEKTFSLQLYDALKNLFPLLDFKLIVIKKANAQPHVEVLANITLCYFTNVDEHRYWEPFFTQ